MKTEEEFEDDADYDDSANENQYQTESQEPSVEPSVEPEQPAPVWFLDFLNTDDIEITPDRASTKFEFQSNKYQIIIPIFKL
ncbi:unnamed protein product [[Candida] boidinii]|nr:unnamed protein product [[Candida] boidinii]